MKTEIDVDIDLERMNFLSWYQDATPEDIKTAWKNNAKKLEEMMEKYKYEIRMGFGI